MGGMRSSGKGYERMIKRMRSEGSRSQGSGIVLATMQSADKVKIGDLTLDYSDGDFVKAESIESLSKGDDVLAYRLSDDLYAVICKVV
jgi:hypothetical protein